MIISHVPAYNFEYMVHQVNVYDCKADEQTDGKAERRREVRTVMWRLADGRAELVKMAHSIDSSCRGQIDSWKDGQIRCGRINRL